MTRAFESVDELEAGTREALRRLILSLADTKRMLGIRYSDWLLGAPSIEAGIAASSLSQDEWGHARLIYSLLKDLGEDPLELEHERAAEDYCSVPALDDPLEDWAAFVAAVVVVDGALSVALEAIGEGTYGTFAGRVPKMLAEEEFHRDFGKAWLRRLARSESGGRAALRGHVEHILPSTLDALFPADPPHGRLVEAGIAAESSELRGRFRSAAGSLLRELGVEVPSEGGDDPEWDVRRSRGAGHPGEEAVERARGDRNRALFVE